MGVYDSHAIVPQHVEVDTVSYLGNQGAESLSKFSELQFSMVLTTENLSHCTLACLLQVSYQDLEGAI